VRLQDEVETTGTLKYRKVDLVREGFDPMNTSDLLFVADVASKSYLPITADVLRDVLSGKLRL
jgi:hypothetical protein